MMKKIGIIGPNKDMCSTQLYCFGVELGLRISDSNRFFICGGHGGFMEAVCKGVKQSPNTFTGQTIGILPEEDAASVNQYIDLTIPTGMGMARNAIIVRSSDVLIAAGGGAGTLSEIAFAWQLNKRVLCITLFEGWAKELSERNIDTRQDALLIPVHSIDDIINHLADNH